MTILPNREALFEQFLGRARSGEYEEWWDKRETLRRVKRKLRAATAQAVAQASQISKEGHLTLLSVYASDERLNTWISRWENFLESVRREPRRRSSHLCDARSRGRGPKALSFVAQRVSPIRGREMTVERTEIVQAYPDRRRRRSLGNRIRRDFAWTRWRFALGLISERLPRRQSRRQNLRARRDRRATLRQREGHRRAVAGGVASAPRL